MKSVLFACNMNSVRSPMAAALLRAQARGRVNVDSAGVYEGALDPFVAVVLGEINVPLEEHEPKPMRALDLAKFDLAVALTPEAAEEARRLMARERVEYWPTENPTDSYGGRDEILAAYRRVRDDLRRKLAQRFPDLYEKP